MPAKPIEQSLRTAELTKEEVVAIKALAKGEANNGQQVLALSVIVKKFSRAFDLVFVPGKPDETNFLAGRTFVGLQITKTINQKMEG